jgi:hypothetical protein
MLQFPMLQTTQSRGSAAKSFCAVSETAPFSFGLPGPAMWPGEIRSAEGFLLLTARLFVAQAGFALPPLPVPLAILNCPN